MEQLILDAAVSAFLGDSSVGIARRGGGVPHAPLPVAATNGW